MVFWTPDPTARNLASWFGGVFSNTLSQVTFSTNYFFNAYPIEFRDPRTVGTNGFGLRRECHVLGVYEVFGVPGNKNSLS